MKIKKRSIIQFIITVIIIFSVMVYYLYINDIIDFKILSIREINPYGGWSAIKSFFTDLTYRWRGFSRSIALTAAIAVTALFMGRFFCSFICPIGALQDFFKYVGTKIGINERKLIKFKTFNPEIIKYIIFIILLAASILGLGNYMSPLSPWIAYLNIFLGFKLQLVTVILLFIVVISLFVKRVFCRVFCPLGAFQGLLYAIGPLKIYKSNECRGCSNCIKNCPVDINTGDRVISPECINCLECTEKVCINGGNGYSLKFSNRKLSNKQYVIICIILLVSIYTVLPLLPSASRVQLLGNIGAINDGIYIGEGIGFGGNMQVEVTIEKNKINNIEIINQRETTGYYEEVFKKISQEIVETQNLNVDAISGATASSRGFLSAIKDGVSKAIDKQ